MRKFNRNWARHWDRQVRVETIEEARASQAASRARHGKKVAFCVALAVEDIVRKSRVPILATFTFKENITDMVEAKRRWHRLRERIKRRYGHVKGVGVWQRQARGAWHVHLVLDRFYDVGWLRDNAVECGFGPFVDLKFIRYRPGFHCLSGKTVAMYLTRYMTREDSEGNGARTVTYLGDARIGSCRCSWARGMSSLYRHGRSHFFEIFERAPYFEEYWMVVRLGWEFLDPLVQDAMLDRYPGVRKWWYGDFDPDPF